MWKKGQSGNPKGRAKEQVQIQELARSHSAKAMATLVELLDDENSKVRYLAAQYLLNRAWGTPTQSHEVTGADGAALIPSISVNIKQE